MAVKRKTRLYSIFIRYLLLFCINTVVLMAVVFLLFNLLINSGAIVRADAMQNELEKNAETIRTAEIVTGEMMPDGCEFGVYKEDGTYIHGTYEEKEREQAWSFFENGKSEESAHVFYRFIVRENSEVCIARYSVAARFSNALLRKYLPAADWVFVLIFFVLFLLQALLLAKHFGKYLTRRLNVLNSMTKRIENQNLEFEEEHSNIQEIDDVLSSLFHMKRALQESLEQQWDAEQKKREQVAALVHDIKTPLTIIKGNAQLASEADTVLEGKEYSGYVLQSAAEIERYVVTLQEMLLTQDSFVSEPEQIVCRSFVEKLIEQAERMAKNKGLHVIVEKEEIEGTLFGDSEQLYRVWNNVVSNAVEYSPEGSRILLHITRQSEKLILKVTDSGHGFSDEELKNATEQFYQGDKSRHSKAHRGLGLYIAETFSKQQGGTLRLGNSSETGGGEVTIEWIIC